MEDDEANFNPNEVVRDYQALGDNLKVFCVSARAYQKLSDRLKKDVVQVGDFASTADTDIPTLQDHTRGLTEAGRAHNCRRFLNDLTQLINSMKLWSSTSQSTVLGKEAQKLDEQLPKKELEQLKTVSTAVGS